MKFLISHYIPFAVGKLCNITSKAITILCCLKWKCCLFIQLFDYAVSIAEIM